MKDERVISSGHASLRPETACNSEVTEEDSDGEGERLGVGCVKDVDQFMVGSEWWWRDCISPKKYSMEVGSDGYWLSREKKGLPPDESPRYPSARGWDGTIVGGIATSDEGEGKRCV